MLYFRIKGICLWLAVRGEEKKQMVFGFNPEGGASILLLLLEKYTQDALGKWKGETGKEGE